MNDRKSKASLEQLLASMGEGEEFINNTSPLQKDDYALIGEFVQMFCWADLNGRRLVNQLRRINSGDDSEFASRLTDLQVLEHLNKESQTLAVLPNVREGIRIAVEILMMHRQRRHEFSHWSFRRVSGMEYFVLLTKNTKEAKVRDVELEGHEGLGFGLVSISSLSKELKKLNGHIEYLARLVAVLDDYEENLKAQ